MFLAGGRDVFCLLAIVPEKTRTLKMWEQEKRRNLYALAAREAIRGFSNSHFIADENPSCTKMNTHSGHLRHELKDPPYQNKGDKDDE